MSGVYWNKKRGFWKSFRVFPIVLIAWRSLLTRLLAFWLKSWRRNYLVATTLILWMMLCEIRSANILRRHMNITWREQGLVYKSTYFQIFEVSFTCLQVIWLKDQITLDWKRETNHGSQCDWLSFQSAPLQCYIRLGCRNATIECSSAWEVLLLFENFELSSTLPCAFSYTQPITKLFWNHQLRNFEGKLIKNV